MTQSFFEGKVPLQQLCSREAWSRDAPNTTPSIVHDVGPRVPCLSPLQWLDASPPCYLFRRCHARTCAWPLGEADLAGGATRNKCVWDGFLPGGSTTREFRLVDVGGITAMVCRRGDPTSVNESNFRFFETAVTSSAATVVINRNSIFGGVDVGDEG